MNLETIPVPFKIDKNTPEIEIKLEKNPDYNPNILQDTDLDKIENYKDNCPEIFNPMQEDSDAD
jgi:ABC-type transport system substrate-binding protein